MSKSSALVRDESAQSTTEYAVLTSAVAIGIISTVSVTLKALDVSVSGWFQRLISGVLIQLSSPMDMLSIAKELWRY